MRDSRIQIKVCGVTRAEDVQSAASLSIDALGLNFAPESSRRITLDLAAELTRAVPRGALLWVGVFVNPSREFLLEAVSIVGLDIVQLHGEELPEFVAEIRAVLPSVKIWKALRVATREDLDAMTRYACDGFVIDAKVPGARGGTGHTFDWSILSGVPRSAPLILSGGLNPKNVADAVRAVSPDWVDTASGVESAPGIKDAAKMREFVLQCSSVNDSHEGTKRLC